MGYWNQDSSGQSFSLDPGVTDEKQEMIWGDSPADAVDSAIHFIKIAFLRDIGRLPSKAEIIAGIKFSASALEGLPERPEDAVPLTREQQAVVDEYGCASTGGDRFPTSEDQAAQEVASKKISALLREVAPR